MIPDPARAAVSGGELAYVDLGEGPPVVLLHGFPTSSFLWRREIPVLAQRHRVIAPDLLGHGRSDRPDGADLSITAQAARVRELLAGLGIERPAVIGHDLGGGVAQLLALDGDAAALVLLDAVAFDAWPVEGMRALQAMPPELHTAEVVERAVRSTFAAGVAKRALDEHEIAGYLGPWLEDPAAFFRAAHGADGVGLAGREADLEALGIPTFVIWGEEDPYLGVSLAERLGELISWSMVALLPGCSHFVTEDAGPTVDQLLADFLRLRYLGESHAHEEAGPVPIFLSRPPDRYLHDEDADED